MNYKTTCSILNKIGMSRQILVKVPNVKFHESPFRDSCVVTFDRMTDGQTDMEKQTGAFSQLRQESA
jgi:hypothetical protein